MQLSQALNADHYEEIVVQSAVDPDVASARGYRTLTGTGEERDELREIGYKPVVVDNEATYPALLIPMLGATGQPSGYQIKPKNPRTRLKSDGGLSPIKYESPAGAPLVVDMPAASLERLRADAGCAVWITEGMKKTDALVSQGAAAFGLTGVFNWRNKLGTLGDWEDVPLKGRPVVVCFDSDAVGNRNVQLAMTRLGAWLKTRGASAVHYVVTPDQVDGTPTKGVDDYFAAGGDLAGLHSVATQTPPGGGAADASFSDAYLVEEVCSGALDGRFIWSSGLGWMKWNGRIWQDVADTEPVEAVRQWALSQFESALSDQKKDPSRDLMGKVAGWRSVLAKNRIRALMDLARGIIERYADEFDGDPDLLTVQNGTIHLPSGKLLPFDPTHLITKIAGAEYRPGHVSPVWGAALSAVPMELHEWYRDRMGQAITGYKTPDHMLVLSYGGGSNGKSVVTSIIRKALGDYGIMISDRVLMASPDAHPTELMDLRGARYAVLEETPEARHLNVQRLKTTLGTEYVKARRIRQDPVEFIATHSLFINSNYKPVVNETDHGTWRRLGLLTFPYTFRRREADMTGPNDRLGDPALEYAHSDSSVLSAALSWMVMGAKAWYARGRMMLPLPDAVEQDTMDWRSETDLVMGFTAECLTLAPDSFLSAPDLLSAFNSWAGDRGHRPWNDKTLASRFGAHDVIRAAKVSQGRKYVNGRQVRGWFGVSIAKPGEAGGDPFSDDPGPQPEPGKTHETDPVDVTDVVTETRKTDETAAPELPSEPVVVGFDIETADADELFMGRHDGPFVRLVGGIGPETDPDGAVGPFAPALLEQLRTADVIYGHNVFKFDLVALAYHHGADYDALAAKTIDTLPLVQAIDPPAAKGEKPWGSKGYYGLDQVAQRLGHTGKSDDLRALADEFGGYDKIPTDDPRYADYLRGDLSATKYVYDKLIAGGLTDYARREIRVAALQNRMTLNGWAVDTELLAERVAAEDARRGAAVAALRDEFGMPTDKVTYKLLPKAQWPEDYQGQPVVTVRAWFKENPEDAVQEGVAERRTETYAAPWNTDAGKAAIEKAFADAGAPYVPRTRTGQIALSKEAMGDGYWVDPTGTSRPGMLRAYGDHPGVVRLCELIGQATGATAKYAEIAKWTNDRGRVHPVVGDVQASGRWATIHFASSNMGARGEAIEQRRVLVADPGHVLITCDLSQVDMRAVAGLSQDWAYMDLFQPGRDAHMDMAEVFFGARTKDNRSKTKAINHGLNYGQSDRAVAERNRLPLELVQNASQARADAFPRLIEWTQEVRDLGASGQLLDNGFGRLMRCNPDRAWTQAPALMGQGAARDIMTESLLRFVDMAEDAGRGKDARDALRGVVHDEVIVSVPEAEAEFWSDLLRDAFTWEWKGVPILCEVSNPGRSWADCEH